MIVRHLPEAIASGRRIQSTGWESTRLVLKNDNAGFSFHITTIYRGAELPMHYRNHIESVYCISGSGEIETVADGKIYPIAPGTIYVLDQHDQHILRAETEMVMACVFNPPLHGTEVHDADGVYPLEAEAVTD
ncbi:ectoine synthase [Candidatus Macondimonas diazotrophica]|jgi:L-ectoine synthase|uniref:L-ectoine synthase n=1 Tax=Candidatus Macondimonas diazotrophica TaxID=2305248 RepID=A0A4Z0F8H3_9GAMM|nr:ectoine synthase [Candidatus Macondimonas diazotrophica]MDY6956717.1 ectoine synthase [Pseudomonadota bacterium]HBG31889.1 L-ectoine synthase [Gammaproteobacteria bacterium]NCU00157.1 ectoine synthase [Candidatus Macondimonas diazotrophica]TFZ81813.1 ectoine synthase [Candidatus Macondimonas diazotrophica]HBG50254.1 L-ectoine synthase [Gammaproteobacteria bacterium]